MARQTSELAYRPSRQTTSLEHKHGPRYTSSSINYDDRPSRSHRSHRSEYRHRDRHHHSPTRKMSPAHEDALKACMQYLEPASKHARSGREEEIRTSPLFSLTVKHLVDENDSSAVDESSSDGVESFSSDDASDLPIASARSRKANRSKLNDQILPQYGLLGFNIGASDAIDYHEPIMLNVHAPNSAFICGSQGSGKSYTLSCMLENCLFADDGGIGALEHPLAGVVFHYDVDGANSIAEAAHLCSRGIPVKVLVSNSNYHELSAEYARIPGAKEYLTVQPLLIDSSDLSVERMHKLMAFSEKGGHVPLYMEVVMRILREMAINGQGRSLDYRRFLAQIKDAGLSRDQMVHLDMRLGLLESFMASTAKSSKKISTAAPLFALQPGTLTVIDLSDPFLDAATVCVLFDICLGLAKEKRGDCGLVVALDEAHKYMNKSDAANIFTDRLLTTIREQRHNATRVIIATQEPTISERLLDLCSVTIVHHFKSPAWFAAVRSHLGGASSLVNSDTEHAALFERIIDLQVGESLVFAPGAFVCIDAKGQAKKLGSRVLKMKTRMRLGADAGRSILAA